MLKGVIKGQTFELYSSRIIEKSKDYITGEFTFGTPDWDGCSKSIFFKHESEDTPFQILLSDNKFTEDAHVNLKEGKYDVYLKGLNGDTRITTNICELIVEQTGDLMGDSFQPEPPGILDQLEDKIDKANTNADAALEEVIKVRPYMERAETAAGKAETSEFNAKTYASNAKTSETNAKTSETNAGTSETNAKTSETNEGTSESNAKTYQDNAKTYQDNAKTYQDNAKTYQDNAKVSEDNAKDSEDNAKTSEDNAKTSEDNAKTSEDNAKTSETNSHDDSEEAKQALSDLLAMLGTDIPTLVDGKVPMSQIPATATQEIYEVTDESELVTLIAQRGDLAEQVEDIDGVRTVTKTWQLLGDDASVADNWVVWGTSYAVQAGSATTAGQAENANQINNHRMVEMTKTAWETAVKDPSTYYLIYDDTAEV